MSDELSWARDHVGQETGVAACHLSKQEARGPGATVVGAVRACCVGWTCGLVTAMPSAGARRPYTQTQMWYVRLCARR